MKSSFLITHFSFLIKTRDYGTKRKGKEAECKAQEENGKKVVMWIIGAFIVLAVFYLIFVASNF